MTKNPKKKSKFLAAISNLEKKELSRFKKLVNSPYFNRDESLGVILSYVLDQNLTSIDELEKRNIWEQVKPLPYNDVRFRKYFSDLLGLLEKFLILDELEHNDKESSVLLLRAIGRKGVKSLQKSVQSNSEKKIHQSHTMDSQNLFYQYLLEKEIYNLEYRFTRKKVSNIQNILHNLDQFYFAERFKLASDQISRSRFVDIDRNDKVGSHIFSFLREEEIKLEEIGKVYQAVYENQKEEDTTSYFQLRKIIKQLNRPMTAAEGGSIYASQINFCIKQINSGNSAFLVELMTLYKELIDQNLILINDLISPNTYTNISVTALRNQEYQWAENFVSEYAKYLPREFKENLPKHQLSRVYFYKGEFSKVIELLSGFEFSDKYDNLQAKALLIQTYYELSEIDALDSLLKSLKTYLTRHKEIDSGRRKNFKNLIKIVSQMMSIIPGDKKRIDKLKKAMSEMQGVAANKEWLEEKIAELER